MEKEKVLVTSALPYANGPIHLGHLSGAYLPADIYVRYKRLKGDDIIYICGSDEHGVPITITADKEKVTPGEIIDRYHGINKNAFESFGMSFDIYSRTSIPVHHETAREFFLSFHNNELLNEKKTSQFYDEKAGIFLPDRYVEGVCPKCGYDEARSDECEKCGSLYDSSELLSPKSKISGETPILKETSHWYFPLGKFQERLEAYVDEMNSKYKWKDNVLQYCKGWFKDGLRDRAVTRDLDWGVKLPLEGSAGKVLYVWFEAVLGYISATKELGKQRGTPDLWREYWQGGNTKYIAFIGKDNVVFHTIIFPAMLMAWNDYNQDKFILPQNVPANEFLNFEGKKFSKSRGWGIDVIDFLNEFPADPLRYTLGANLPEAKDTDFYWKEFQARNNNELADILGNFINRTFIFASKHFGNEVPHREKLTAEDEAMIELIKAAPAKIGSLLENYKIKESILEMMNFARAGNKYFNDSEPWKKIKTDKESAAATINICLQTAYALALTFNPVIPFSSAKIFKMLNSSPCLWNEISGDNLAGGHKLGESEILFPKIEDSAIQKHIDKLVPAEETNVSAEPVLPQIEYDDFKKLDIRTGTILSADAVPKSKKLIKLLVQDGLGERQIIAGIASGYFPEELKGRKIVFLANLKPAKIMGLESNGMVLAAESGDGKPSLLSFDPNVKNGTKIR